MSNYNDCSIISTIINAIHSPEIYTVIQLYPYGTVVSCRSPANRPHPWRPSINLQAWKTPVTCSQRCLRNLWPLERALGACNDFFGTRHCWALWINTSIGDHIYVYVYIYITYIYIYIHTFIHVYLHMDTCRSSLHQRWAMRDGPHDGNP